MSESLETEMWSKQDLNFRPRFSSARRQPIVAFNVTRSISVAPYHPSERPSFDRQSCRGELSSSKFEFFNQQSDGYLIHRYNLALRSLLQ